MPVKRQLHRYTASQAGSNRGNFRFLLWELIMDGDTTSKLGNARGQVFRHIVIKKALEDLVGDAPWTIHSLKIISSSRKISWLEINLKP